MTNPRLARMIDPEKIERRVSGIVLLLVKKGLLNGLKEKRRMAKPVSTGLRGRHLLG